MKNKLIFVLLSLFGLTCNTGFSQEQNTVEFDEKESFDNYPDGIYKDEMALFILKCSSPQNAKTKPSCFGEFEVRSLIDGEAQFVPSEFAYRNRPISIAIEGDDDTTTIKYIFYTFMKHYCYIPYSAISDIINPTFSVYWITDNETGQASHRHGFKSVWNKNKHRPIIDNWEIYIPKDAFRLYIHMANYKYRYEVTWIIDKEKYVGRVIDKLE
jgi:hypothetical protein